MSVRGVWAATLAPARFRSTLPLWLKTLICQLPNPVPVRSIKTNSSAKKRFKVNAAGNVRRGKAGRRHNTGPKKRQNIRELGKVTGIKVGWVAASALDAVQPSRLLCMAACYSPGSKGRAINQAESFRALEFPVLVPTHKTIKR